MRAVLHVLSALVLIPYIALASAFAILRHAISSGSLLSLFETLLAHAVWIVPWGIIGFGCLIVVVAALGIAPRLRWLGGVCLCVLAAGSLAVIVVASTSPVALPELLFLSPCIAVLVFGAWLAVAEQRFRRASEIRPDGRSTPG